MENYIKGLDEEIYLGADVKTILNKYDCIENLPAVETETITAYDGKYKGIYHIGAADDGYVFSIDFVLYKRDYGKTEDIVRVLTSLYGEPAHIENYKDKRKPFVDIIWNVNESTKAVIVVNTKTGGVKKIEYSERNIEDERIAQDKYNVILNETDNDPDLKSFYEFLLFRSNIQQNDSIETVLNLHDVKYIGMGDFGRSSFICFEDNEKILGIDFTTRYEVASPYLSKSKYDGFAGRIDSVSISFDYSKKSTDKVIEFLNRLFGECTVNVGTYKDTEYKWRGVLPFNVTLMVHGKKTGSKNILTIEKNNIYMYQNPKFEYDGNIVDVPPYSNVSDDILFNGKEYLGCVTEESFKGKRIFKAAKTFAKEKLHNKKLKLSNTEISKIGGSNYKVRMLFNETGSWDTKSIESLILYIADKNGNLELVPEEAINY